MGLIKAWRVFFAVTAFVAASLAHGAKVDGTKAKVDGARAKVDSRSAPFEQALEAIVPLPYRIEVRAPVQKNMILSWRESDNWMRALQEAIAPYGLQAKHDLERNVVVIYDDKRPFSPNLSSSDSDKDSGKNPNEASVSAPTKHWLIRKGERLSQAITAFAAENGWTVKWRSAVDWTVPADISIEVSDPVEAIDKIARWLHEEGVAIQFYAYMTNRILVAQPLTPQESKHHE